MPALQRFKLTLAGAGRSLSIRNYRLFLTGHVISVIGTWMQRVAQDWLVLELTDSAIAVGIAAALQFTPLLLFGLWGGVLVDRLDRRRLIMQTQFASAICASALAIVVLTGVVELWMIFLLAVCLGFATMLDSPARQAFVAQLVGSEHYVNGQALAASVHNAGRLIGPALAGILIAGVGPGLAFATNAVSFIPVLVGLAMLDQSSISPLDPPRRAPGQIREGLRYVHSRPDLRTCMLLVAVVALFGQNFRVILPLLAKGTLAGGPETYGWLTSALGLGAVLGALVTASRRSVTPRSLTLAALLFGTLNLAISLVPGLTTALVGMFALGFANITFNTMARTLLQLGTAPQMHGRVMSLHGLVFLGTTPIGGPLIGWVCESTGPRSGFIVAGITAVVASIAVLPSSWWRVGPRPLPPVSDGAETLNPEHQ